ncbi:hypothetical protein [endosymbiont of unidentified scaly snail isolate Monju]|uniref:hypothetical protein n=1 Tax=endosymbiont of unidentified scaly snail isolate Monju TaxID=1248727 RepID=UPI001494E8E7|nr:hypothetical protein [endosymbiont of unidentified scaly snail isolate Monju]
MRFVQILFVALALILAWQGSVLAALSAAPSCIAAADNDTKTPDDNKGEEDEEPECD